MTQFRCSLGSSSHLGVAQDWERQSNRACCYGNLALTHLGSFVSPPNYLYNQCTFSEHGKLFLIFTQPVIRHFPRHTKGRSFPFKSQAVLMLFPRPQVYNQDPHYLILLWKISLSSPFHICYLTFYCHVFLTSCLSNPKEQENEPSKHLCLNIQFLPCEIRTNIPIVRMEELRFRGFP